MSAANDLTGTWHGIFNYPRDMAPNAFLARLIDQNGALSGESVEQCDDPYRPRGEIVAVLTGQRIGDDVTFEKRYDNLERADYVVHYSGRVADEGMEIGGRWSIPGIWSGTFVMVREQGATTDVAETVSETVR